MSVGYSGTRAPSPRPAAVLRSRRPRSRRHHRAHRRQELHRARRPHAADQGHQPRQLADARGLHVQVRGGEVAAPDLRRLRPPAGASSAPRRSGGSSATPTSRRTTLPSSSRSASTPCASRCTIGCSWMPTARSRARAGSCSTVSWAGVRDAGLLAIVDLHAAPGGQTGINHDDGPGYPLMFYVSRDRVF